MLPIIIAGTAWLFPAELSVHTSAAIALVDLTRPKATSWAAFSPEKAGSEGGSVVCLSQGHGDVCVGLWPNNHLHPTFVSEYCGH